MGIRATLVTLYAFIATLLFLYVYPLAPEKLIALLVAVALAATAAITAYSVPRYTGIVFFLVLHLALLNIVAASSVPWLRLALSEATLLVYMVLLSLLAAAAAASVKRYLGVVALATGLLAAAALTAPYGHLAALALLAIYAAVSGSVTRTLMALVYEEEMRLTLLTSSLVAEAPRCFTAFNDIARLIRPVKPLVDALLAPQGSPSPSVIAGLPTLLMYSAVTMAGYAAILGLVSLVSRYVQERLTKWVPEATAITKHAVIYSATAAPLAYLASVNISIAASIALHCRFYTPPFATLGLMLTTGILALLVQLLVFISALRSLREEKTAIEEALRGIEAEIARVLSEMKETRISPKLYEKLVESIRGNAKTLLEKARHAGLLSLPSLERLLAMLEEEFNQANRRAVENLVSIAEAAKRACSSISAWAVQHQLPEGECDTIPIPDKNSDLHVALAKANTAVEKLLEYIHVLVDEVADMAEEHGLDIKWAEKLHEELDSFRVESPGDIEKLRNRVVEELSRLLGAIRAREE